MLYFVVTRAYHRSAVVFVDLFAERIPSMDVPAAGALTASATLRES